MKASFLSFLWLLCCTICEAQTATSFVKNGKANTDSFIFNQRDAAGKAYGLWYRLQPAQRGEASYWEFGYYQQGRRNGPWYTLTRDGELMAIENFKNNALNGEAKYFEKGKLTAVGHYRGLNPDNERDTIVVTDPVTLDQYYVSIENERGHTKHGNWQYFNPETGKKTKEEEWQVDELISRKDFTYTVSDSTRYNERLKQLPHTRHPKATHASGKTLIGD